MSTSSGLTKTILQGTVHGGRKRGRQRMRWDDNIKELTVLKTNEVLRKTDNRENGEIRLSQHHKVLLLLL
jgi:hypothetical protein